MITLKLCVSVHSFTAQIVVFGMISSILVVSLIIILFTELSENRIQFDIFQIFAHNEEYTHTSPVILPLVNYSAMNI